MVDEETDRPSQQFTPDAPELTYSEEKGYENKRPAVEDESEASEIFKNLFDDAEIVISKAAMIRKKLDGIDPPYNPYALQQTGKSNKSNISTGFLASTASKVSPRLYSYINNTRYLTAVDLPPYIESDDGQELKPIENHQEKSRALKEIFSRKTREWSKWFPFLVGLSQETANLGHAFAAFTDDLEWRPTLYRLDHAQVPTGTEVLEEEVPFFGIRDELMVHELFEKVEDYKIAQEEGWEVDNVLEALARAAPLDLPDTGEEEDAISYQDMIRELIPEFSRRKNANIVEIGHLFVLEYDGTVSHWMFERETENLLYKKERRFERMSDVVTVFTFEFGNGRVHGSQGIGHKLYDIAVGVEKARNSAIDNLRNRGKIQIKVEGGASALQKAKVIHHDDMTLISGAEPVGSSVSLPDVTESAIALDNWMINLAEMKIGAYTPPPRVPGVNTTATQESITAQRENEERRVILEFWLKNVSVLMHAMARRMFNPESTDRVAIQARKEAQAQGITDEEIDVWRNSYPSGSLLDMSDVEDQKLVAYIQTKLGNPRYRQDRLEYDQTSAAIGDQYAERYVIPEADQTVASEAVRMQELELSIIEKGVDVPVSPRDNHLIHMEILRGQKNPQTGFYDQGAISAFMAQQNYDAGVAAFEHYTDHFQIAESENILGERINEERDFQSQFRRAMEDLQRQAEQNEGPPTTPNPQQPVDGQLAG